MKSQNQAIISFAGMQFKREDHASMRLRKRSQQIRHMKDQQRLAHNVRGLFGLFN